MAISRTKSKTVKEQIADDIRQVILAGELVDGDRLPTESELIERYQVARNTARDALAILVNEGLIVSRRPHGYFVRRRRRMEHRPQRDLSPEATSATGDSFITEQSEAGRNPSQHIDVAIVVPPDEVAHRLEIKSGEPCVVRRRIRYLDGDPFLTNDSYFPLDVVQNTAIMNPEDIKHGANRTLADCGHRQIRAIDEFIIRMPTPEESKRLDLAPGTPVACQFTTGIDQDEKPVRVAVSILPGDRHVIIYERKGLPLPTQETSR